MAHRDTGRPDGRHNPNGADHAGLRKTLTPFSRIARRVKYAVGGHRALNMLVEHRVGKARLQRVVSRSRPATTLGGIER
ncbi:MAG: hypothetical protein F9K13_05215 [Candidatus Methylomirabilis oxygeniifera]|nr:MAG: hypothetical protein F9K13_05215 [Candidatus Methylomirabilis oxyfera]